jgi:serine/threonine-protein kinase
MVLVPAGDALIGPDRQRTHVAAFYIDRTEVTVSAYQAFLGQTGARAPAGFDAGHSDLPVVNVSFDDAQAFARWANKRLPTAVEWEKAARGSAGQTFPWGNDAGDGVANVPPRQGEATRLEPASARAQTDSPYGVRNLVGNVWEWVDTRRDPEPEEFKMLQARLRNLRPPLTPTEPFHMIRGGSYRFFVPRDMLSSLVVDSGAMPARVGMPDIGFRCARSVP